MKYASIFFFYLFFTAEIKAQTEYSLQDINPNSSFYGESVGTTYFQESVIIHYFGHFN